MLKVHGEAFYRSGLALDRMRIYLGGKPADARFYSRDVTLPSAMYEDMTQLRSVFSALGVPMTLKSLGRLIDILDKFD